MTADCFPSLKDNQLSKRSWDELLGVNDNYKACKLEDALTAAKKFSSLHQMHFTKLAHLAKACTQENPQLRPSMRSIVIALVTLSSSTDEWDVGSSYKNQDLVNLMSGR
ncbi:hypothetical protein F0562_011147 [Nyssa sinensis]|uniref:Serine-threonine/tyrosine-protein kinase catalytic domain-containing protein n=1 Tax=Nyssa sinensis TaxID=561372 RepID=A0A5J5A3E2_9ASTE|nr:hypothetical protein F0562_011147 [Nyssa sinensis]